MGIHKLEKEIFIGDSAATSYMTSDPTGLYHLQKISAQLRLEMDKTLNGPTKDYWMLFVFKMMAVQSNIHGK